jgi:hypothetical protein
LAAVSAASRTSSRQLRRGATNGLGSVRDSMLWYAELALHRLIDFRGQYANRFGAKMTGDVESVPWT